MSGCSQSPLPVGWVLRRIEDILGIDGIQVDSTDEDFSKLQFLGLENLESGTRQFVIPEENAETAQSACWRFGPKHVLYGKLRPYLNKVYLPDKEGRCSLEILPLLPKNGFSRDFAAAVLQSPDVVKFATQHSTGGRMPRVDMKKLLALEVATPETADSCNRLGDESSQRLDKCVSMRCAAKRELEASTAMEQAFLQPLFPFGDVKNLPPGWSVQPLRDLRKSIEYGLSKTSTRTPVGPKYVRITDIQDGEVNWDSVPYCECSEADTVSCKLEDGDILFARTGATTGKSYLIYSPPKAVFASYLIRVQCNAERVLPDYLYAFFQSQIYWRAIGKDARGGAQAGFNATMLGDLLVPLPATKDDQAQIVSDFRKHGLIAQRIKRASERQLEAVVALPSATLREFFTFGNGVHA